MIRPTKRNTSTTATTGVDYSDNDDDDSKEKTVTAPKTLFASSNDRNTQDSTSTPNYKKFIHSTNYYTTIYTSDKESTSDEEVHHKPKAKKAPRQEDEDSSNTTTEPHEQIIDTFLPPSKYAAYTPVQKKNVCQKTSAQGNGSNRPGLRRRYCPSHSRYRDHGRSHDQFKAKYPPSKRQRHVTINTPTETPPTMNAIADSVPPPSVPGEPSQINIKRECTRYSVIVSVPPSTEPWKTFADLVKQFLKSIQEQTTNKVHIAQWDPDLGEHDDPIKKPSDLPEGSAKNRSKFSTYFSGYPNPP
jgi:hypothetical protein